MHTTVIISGCASLEDDLAQLCRMLNQVQHDRWRVTLNSIQGLFHSSVSSGLNVLVTPHIYHLPEQDPIWSELTSIQGSIILVSPLYSRPAEWLFRKHWNGESLTALNIADYASAKECHAAIMGLCEPSSLLDFPLSTLHSPFPLAGTPLSTVRAVRTAETACSSACLGSTRSLKNRLRCASPIAASQAAPHAAEFAPKAQ